MEEVKNNFELMKEFFEIVSPEDNDYDTKVGVQKLREWFVEKPERVGQILYIVKTMSMLVLNVGQVALDDVKEMRETKNVN